MTLFFNVKPICVDMSRIFEAPFNKMLHRPCIVVSTISSNGVSNGAPFSFNSPGTTKPPTYGFCCEVEHDTLKNIRENNEFVVNLVGEDFGPLIKDLARDLPYGVSEIIESGLTEVPSKKVMPPRIGEAYGWLECRRTKIVDLSPRAVWIFGEILVSEIKREAFDEVVDVEQVKPLHHIWGEDYVVGGSRKKYER
jgi:flavin reductase (DIM6/NTAB) family NADH-FMN oxidoreductase RutF